MRRDRRKMVQCKIIRRGEDLYTPAYQKQGWEILEAREPGWYMPREQSFLGSSVGREAGALELDHRL